MFGKISSRPMAASLLTALVIWELLLALASGCGWFGLGIPKGWGSLFCAATAGAALLAMALWLVAAVVGHWRFQFQVISLMLLVLAIAIPCGWLTRDARQAARQHEIVARAGLLRCGIFYDYNLSPSGEVQFVSGVPPGATFLDQWFGRDFFHHVVGAQPKTDAALLSLQEFSGIRRLYGDNSELTNEGLKALPSFQQLEWLDLRDAPRIGDAGLRHLQGLRRLKGLLLRRTDASDIGMAYLDDLKDLEVLDLGMTRVTNDGMKHVANLVRLRQLSFWANQIEDSGLAHFQGLSALETLELGFAPVTDAGLANLRGLTRLKTLNLRGTRVTGEGLKELADLKELRQLDLYKTQVSDDDLWCLARLAKLESLNLGETQVTDEGLLQLQRSLPACQIVRQ
jgi:Leucine Rich repeat